jgi:Ca-activated chloride channel family protein
MTIAKDVKIQVEFNPAQVLEYRLIGYENRMLAREDFNNDKVDAGEIGAGHRVTALYEVIPVGAKGRMDALRYSQGSSLPATARRASDTASDTELAHVRLRYKAPDGEQSKLLEYPVHTANTKALASSSTDFRFAVSVAGFGQLLRGGKYSNQFDYRDVAQLAKNSVGADREGYRREFLALIDTAAALSATDGADAPARDGAVAQEGR